MDTTRGSFEPDAAMAGIAHAESRVRAGRRWRAGTFAGIGLVTVGYFAVLGGVDFDEAGPVGIALTVAPVIAVLVVAEMLARRRTARSRRLMRHEYVLAQAYGALVLAAGPAAVLLPKPLPAALSGVLPALVCFAGSWEAGRK